MATYLGKPASYQLKMMEKVTEGIYRGSRPTFEDLSLAVRNDVGIGLKAVFNLENDKVWNKEEYEICKAFELEYYNLPLSEIRKPDKEILRNCINIMQKFHKPLLIHCKHGHERTDFIVAYYRMKVEGWSKWIAIKEALQKGFSPLFLWWFL